MFQINFNNPDGEEFFNPHDDTETTYHWLPHISQKEKIYFVTFRLNDSLPKYVLEELDRFRNEFKKVHEQSWTESHSRMLRKMMSRNIEKYLNNGYGSCILGKASVRRHLITAIGSGDGKLYKTGPYVIMPNHVHILFLLLGNHTLEQAMRNIRQRSTYYINRELEMTGKIWMGDYFDTIIRNDIHLKAAEYYIKNNPRNLSPNNYYLYQP